MINDNKTLAEMKIKVNKVEGKTTKKSSKQGRVYEITGELNVRGFFNAITDTGKKMTIWNVNGDWSKIGLCRNGYGRYTYTSDFEILK